jgi:hypothetical protein
MVHPLSPPAIHPSIHQNPSIPPSIQEQIHLVVLVVIVILAVIGVVVVVLGGGCGGCGGIGGRALRNSHSLELLKSILRGRVNRKDHSLTAVGGLATVEPMGLRVLNMELPEHAAVASRVRNKAGVEIAIGNAGSVELGSRRRVVHLQELELDDIANLGKDLRRVVGENSVTAHDDIVVSRLVGGIVRVVTLVVTVLLGWGLRRLVLGDSCSRRLGRSACRSRGRGARRSRSRGASRRHGSSDGLRFVSVAVALVCRDRRRGGHGSKESNDCNGELHCDIGW